jgi:hypothetical protein
LHFHMVPPARMLDTPRIGFVVPNLDGWMCFLESFGELGALYHHWPLTTNEARQMARFTLGSICDGNWYY